MSDKESLEKAFIFGQEAEKVVNNKAYQFAVTAVKGEILQELESIEVLGNNEAILELVRSLQSFNKMNDVLEQVMREGDFAKAQLDDYIKNPQRYNRC